MFQFHTLRGFILDLLFPTTCVRCDAYGAWLCSQCTRTLQAPGHQVCPVCRMQTNGSVCGRCSADTALNGVLISTPYENEVIQCAIHAMKYHYVTGLAQPLGQLLIRTLRGVDKQLACTILSNPCSTAVIPVPLHASRLAERGFNQAELLARIIAQEFRLHCNATSLVRTRATHAQAQLTRNERLTNVLNSFRVRLSFKKTIKNVILIDDVSTTLTTLNECAKVLKQAGVDSVWGLVLARGS
ncbi:MAG: ComF family protein [Patescibacteria group bacterium]|nr:ComF family protein [Patescibacteria group bacterium]MDD5715449.1 ComF family protein [Patescibacteria group bacterium]